MRIAVIYNEPSLTPDEEHWTNRSAPCDRAGAPLLDASEFNVREEARLIGDFLEQGGHAVVLFAADDALALARFLREERPDAIFNCCESFRGDASLEMNVAALYELFGIPFTGSSALALALALDKDMAKAFFRVHGVPTPAHVVAHIGCAVPDPLPIAFPCIVKPLREDASIGIDAQAVVRERGALLRRIEFVWTEFGQPALVEEYIDGRELNVAVLATSENEMIALPISEIVFEGAAAAGVRVLSYGAKWFVNSEEYRSTMSKCPADLPPELQERIQQVALRAARAVRLRDYGRIDLRLRSGDDAIFVLEANPNPDITFDSGFVGAAKAAGRTYAGVIRDILERALERRCGGQTGGAARP
jgi:D-alanine-D-alanine ligase